MTTGDEPQACARSHGGAAGRPRQRAPLRVGVLVGVLLFGCPQALVVVADRPDVPAPDARVVGAVDLGVDASAEPSDAAVLDATSVETPPDGGPQTDAGLTTERPPLTWSVLGFAGSRVTAVACAAPDAILVGTGSGSVIRLDGQGGQRTIWQSPSNFEPVAITSWRDGAGVVSSAVATLNELVIFDGLPDAAAVRVRATVNAELRAMVAIGPGELLALADRQRTIDSDYAILRFPVAGERNQVRVVHSIPDATALEGLGYDAMSTPPMVFTGGGRVFEGDLVARLEARLEVPVGWGPAEVASFDLHTIATVGGQRFAAGDRGAVYRRVSAGWTPLVAPEGREDEVWRAMVPVPGTSNASEAYLVGRASTPGRSSIARLSGGQLTDAGGAQAWDLTDLCFFGPDLAYAVGSFRNELRGLVLRGTR